jgi:hypothetical protein
MPNNPQRLRKLRLLLWPTCNRVCPGCCNNDWELDKLQVCDDFFDYDEILLTGGEPMIWPLEVLRSIDYIRGYSAASMYLYTAKVDDVDQALRVLRFVNGFTVTLHTQRDVAPFTAFAIAYLAKVRRGAMECKSMRLNVFHGVAIDEAATEGFIVKRDMIWIKDCPLPQDEVFMRYEQ